jgi:hypothetical protein
MRVAADEFFVDGVHRACCAAAAHAGHRARDLRCEDRRPSRLPHDLSERLHRQPRDLGGENLARAENPGSKDFTVRVTPSSAGSAYCRATTADRRGAVVLNLMRGETIVASAAGKCDGRRVTHAVWLSAPIGFAREGLLRCWSLVAPPAAPDHSGEKHGVDSPL